MATETEQRLTALRNAVSQAQQARARHEAKVEATNAQYQQAVAQLQALGLAGVEEAQQRIAVLDAEIAQLLATAEAALERTVQS